MAAMTHPGYPSGDTPADQITPHPDALRARPVPLNRITILRPGDRIIFEVNQPVTEDQLEGTRQMITHRLGDDFPFLIVGPGVSPKVVRSSGPTVTEEQLATNPGDPLAGYHPAAPQ